METTEQPRGIAGWIKAAITSVFGLVSGAALMYLTPLVDTVIKPARPVANFATQVQGLTVVFNNRSVGGSQGWWDFGDGSALEPYAPQQDSLSHSFPRPGSYTVKLTLQNLLGEQNERDATVNLEAVAAATAPDVKDFKVTQITPAVFHVTAKVENAQQCIWSLGDHRPLLITRDNAEVERFVTIEKPGRHTLRLVALNGTQAKEQSEQVVVTAPAATSPSGAGVASARLRVTYDAMDVERQNLQRNVQVPWTAGPKDAACPFEVTRLLDNTHKDYQIIAADVTNKKDAQVRNLKIEVSPDKSKYVVKGELLPARRLLPSKQAPAAWVAQVALTLEKRSKPRAVPSEEIPFAVMVPGATAIPIPGLPKGMQMMQKRLHLELSDGSRVVWSGDQPPNNAIVQLGNRPVRVSATEQGNRLVLQVQDSVSAPRTIGN